MHRVAGVIHSDIQRGFIRAEVIKYEDLRDCGSEDAVKRAGKPYLMGRDYTVEGGDIISFRFNVLSSNLSSTSASIFHKIIYRLIISYG